MNRHRARRVREGFLALVGRQPVKVQRNPEEAWEAREAQMLASQKRRETEATAPVEALAGYVTEEKAQALAKEAAEAAVARFAAELAKAGEGGGQP